MKIQIVFKIFSLAMVERYLQILALPKGIIGMRIYTCVCVCVTNILCRTSIFSAFLMNGVMMGGLIAWMQKTKMGLELMMQ